MMLIIFLSSKYKVEKVMDFFSDIDNIGVSVGGNITDDGEFEGEESGISVLAIDKRYIRCQSFSFSVPQMGLREVGRKIAERFATDIPSSLILFPTPFYNIDEILNGIRDIKSDNLFVTGGVASSYGDSPIFTFENGSIGSYAISGVFLEGVEGSGRVAQSCKVVSSKFVVTSSETNVIEEIDGELASDVLNYVASEVITEEPDIGKLPWFVGVEIDSRLELFRFYPILDVKNGYIYVGGEVEVGKNIVFAVMSRKYADEISKMEFSSISPNLSYDFCMIFNCLARGKKFFGRKNHDISIVKKRLKCSIGGFFSNGEIITLGSPFLFTYSAVLANFRKVFIS
ncbi:hypothetical protein HRbin19_00414 [bacterium HR19]|nr:hypothetical protein HRbin19_00414 [bacterium HR19]